MESLQAWCSLPSARALSPDGHLNLTEAPCDECMALARRAFKAQFPNLYTPRAAVPPGFSAASEPRYWVNAVASS